MASLSIFLLRKKEFEKRAPTDGVIYLTDNGIFKVKPNKYNTLDLRYSSVDNVFLDSRGNVYRLAKREEEQDKNKNKKKE